MSHPGLQAVISVCKVIPKHPVLVMRDVSIADALEEIRGGRFAEEIGKVRTMVARHGKDSDEVKAAKLELPAYLFSGKISGKVAQAMNEGRFRHSGLLQLDFDGIEDPEAMRDELIQDPHVLAAWLSPSGEGVKALLVIEPAATEDEHRAAFIAAESYFAARGLTLDKACKNSNRLCFAGWDSEMKVNTDAVPLVIPEPVDAPPPPTKSGLKLSERFSRDWTLGDLAEMLAPIPRPDYDEWLAICSGAWNHFGEAATEILADRWPEESPGEYAEKFPHRTKDHSFGTVVHFAKAHGWVGKNQVAQAAASTSAKKEPPPSKDVFREMLAARVFDAATVPPKPVPVVMLDGKCIGTAGNLMAIQAGIKAGKTAVVGAVNAAFIIGDAAGYHDTLGFSARNPEGHALLHFDTEQSRYDHDGTIRKALSRVRMDEPPVWFQSFSIADLAQGNRVLALETAAEDAVESFGGIRAIIFDGVADLMRDPNDAEEAFGLVDKLHAAAIHYDCLIIAVIHENPGSENGKTRGHLGSQLARKAETNLRLHKDTQTGITTIWADYARHCHIPKDQGTCFSWCDMLGRHVSKGKAGEIKAGIKTEKLREEAEAAFGEAGSMNYAALVSAIGESVGCVKRTAERRVSIYQAEGVVVRTQSGNYTLKA